MTQHPSLKVKQVGGLFRSVLKRYEKLKELIVKEKWDKKKDSIYHMPKIKRIKFKVKKTKGPAEEKEGEAAAGATAAAPGKEAAKETKK
ncbi:MAG: hypothetical protein ABIA77_05485 [Candidatus Omnitrophota bacterium]